MNSWTVVRFIEEDEVEVIPTIWLINDEECFWPTFSKAKLEKVIRSCSLMPENSWKKFKIKILSHKESKFSLATAKATKALYASDVSDAEIQHIGAGNKRIIKKKTFIDFETAGKDSDTDDNSSSTISSEKPTKLLPAFPSLPEQSNFIDFSNIPIVEVNGPIGETMQLVSLPSKDDTAHPNSQIVNLNNLREIFDIGSPEAMVMDVGKDDQQFRHEVISLLIQNKALIKEQQKQLNELIVRINYLTEKIHLDGRQEPPPLTLSMPEIFDSLPISDLEAMDLLEIQLETKDVGTQLSKSLSRLGGGNYKDLIRRIMKKVMVDKMAQLYSWQGHKGKRKFCIMKLASVILEAVQHFDNGQHPVSVKDAENAIAVWLSKATERMKSKINNSNVPAN